MPAIPAARRPTTRETRAPMTTRTSMSRPRWSVPSHALPDGGCNTLREMAEGSRSRMPGPKMATSARSRMKPSATAPARSPVTRSKTLRTRIVRPHPWVDSEVEEIDKQVHDHDRDRREEEDALDDRVVAVRDGRDEEAADARPSEDGLSEHGAGKDVAEVEADDRGDRREAVGKRVPPERLASGQALRLGGEDVVLMERFDHRRPRDPCDHRHVRERERDPGQDQMAEVVDERSDRARRRRDAAHAARRENAERHREDEDEHHREPEHGNGLAADAHHRDEGVPLRSS